MSKHPPSDGLAEAVELLPCPFCGGEASLIGIRNGRQVSCKGRPRVPCFAKGPAVFHGPAGCEACERAAITAWNARAASGLYEAGARLIAVFDQQRMTTAERIITGVSDASLRTEGNAAMNALRAALATPSPRDRIEGFNEGVEAGIALTTEALDLLALQRGSTIPSKSARVETMFETSSALRDDFLALRKELP